MTLVLGHLPAHDPRHVHDPLGRLQLGPLLHPERHRPHHPGLPGRGHALLGGAARPRASTAWPPRGASRAPSAATRSFLLNNLLFVLFTFTVLIGTVFPLIVEAVKGSQMSVGRPYFDRMAVPLGAALLFLMGVGPALPWGRATAEQVRRALLPPTLAAVGLAVLGLRPRRAQPLDPPHPLLRRLHRPGHALASCGCRCGQRMKSTAKASGRPSSRRSSSGGGAASAATWSTPGPSS